MKALITGAGGFVGQLLAARLLADGHELVLTDLSAPPIPSHPSSATSLAADLYTSAASVLSPDLDTIFIFHGIMSAGAEASPALGWRVNLHSTLRLLDAIVATCAAGVRVVYASSTAVYGAPLPEWPDERTLPTPRSSYGAQKAAVEHVLNDYTRRGWINGFALRFPTVSVRPGKPTQAASSFLSGMVREPLQGVESSCPVGDGFEAWMCSPATLVKNLEHAAGLAVDVLPGHERRVNLPGCTVSVREMLEALREVGGEKAVALVKREEGSEEIKAMLDSWPVRFDISRAKKLGFVEDPGFATAVREFKEGLEGAK